MNAYWRIAELSLSLVLDGKASMDSIRKALGMLSPCSLVDAIQADHDDRCDAANGKLYKPDETFVINHAFID